MMALFPKLTRPRNPMFIDAYYYRTSVPLIYFGKSQLCTMTYFLFELAMEIDYYKTPFLHL